MIITIGSLTNALKSKGYAVFEKGYYNLNIVGIRSKALRVNEFNDFICVFYREPKGPKLHIYEATTDPGLYYLNKPLNVNGTAILVPGQYRSVYGLGFHQGQYKALTQKWGSVKVFRDSNCDDAIDMVAIEDGWFGINIHRAGKYWMPMFVDKFSAGCQVIRKYWDFKEFIEICETASVMWGNKFTYTLIEEKDVPSD